MREQEVMLTGVRPTTVAMFEGAFGAIIGLVISIMYLVGGTVAYTNATNSLIQGLLFGLTIGAFSLIFLPMIYFVIGWVIGLVNGWVFNLILRASGGVAIDVAATERTTAQSGSRASQNQQVFGEQINNQRDK
jgi:hypothetical protein